jgi:hypothetical protein
MPARPESLQQVRPLLEAIDGVRCVSVDDAQALVVLVCAADAVHATVTTAAWAALQEQGIGPDELSLEVTVRLASREQQRVRFQGVTRGHRADHRVDVTVALEWNDQLYTSTQEAERAEALELRAVAAAAVAALARIVPEAGDIRIAGVKRVRSFDAELMVASLYRPGSPPQQYVGAVVVGEDPYRAAAVAVLSALNRQLGNYLAR